MEDLPRALSPQDYQEMYEERSFGVCMDLVSRGIQEVNRAIQRSVEEQASTMNIADVHLQFLSAKEYEIVEEKFRKAGWSTARGHNPRRLSLAYYE